MILKLWHWFCGRWFGHKLLKLHTPRTKPQKFICLRCGYQEVFLTLLDHVRRMDKECYIAGIVEMMNRVNDIKDDTMKRRGGPL